ncbi:MAG: hypothetical protein V4638_02465 [Bacteroidota bacterium]
MLNSLSQKLKYLFIATILLGALYSCKSYSHISSTRNNVCKTLEKKTILFAVFVDSDKTHPWLEYDIKSTMDSIQIATTWLEKQATLQGKSISIQVQYGINIAKDSVIPFREEFKYGTLSQTLFKYTDLRKGLGMVDDWSNNVSKDVGKMFALDTSEIVLTKNKPNSRERLIAKLRNQYKTDNIALIFFINNYFENELSVTFHSSSSTETEYAIVSDKQPAVIAHEFLHLFGAWDLYISPFDRGIVTKMRKRRAMKRYPDEIMAFAYRDIDSLSISPLTRYLIGWDNVMDENASKGFVKHRWKLLEY